jgi:hypothetical protein
MPTSHPSATRTSRVEGRARSPRRCQQVVFEDNLRHNSRTSESGRRSRTGWLPSTGWRWNDSCLKQDLLAPVPLPRWAAKP